MVLAKDIEDGFDLDRIDTEMKMEKIRQSASKLTWDGFGQALRRNLMEKRLVCDAESRMDILQAISTMRRSLPENVSSCKIGYFGRLPMDSDYMRNLIKQGDFITLRSSIYAMLATVPNSLNGYIINSGRTHVDAGNVCFALNLSFRRIFDITF
uniref:RNA-directed RNA polymerase n=1 Tax=Heterorhabditis bacteriophora TaxID=37862 RepID=A0A1I7WNL7_HETBA